MGVPRSSRYHKTNTTLSSSRCESSIIEILQGNRTLSPAIALTSYTGTAKIREEKTPLQKRKVNGNFFFRNWIGVVGGFLGGKKRRRGGSNGRQNCTFRWGRKSPQKSALRKRDTSTCRLGMFPRLAFIVGQHFPGTTVPFVKYTKGAKKKKKGGKRRGKKRLFCPPYINIAERTTNVRILFECLLESFEFVSIFCRREKKMPKK